MAQQTTRDKKWLLWAALMVVVSLAIVLGTYAVEQIIEDSAVQKGEVLTGMAIVTTANVTDAQEQKDGAVGFDSLLVGVLVDENARIIDCKIDIVQPKLSFNTKGELSTEPNTVFETKVEKGDGYGMKKNSSIDKEWYEQIAAFEDYLVGKTLSEVKAIPTDDKGYPTEDDLRAGCTVKVADFVKAVVEALENATPMGAAATDGLKIAIEAVVSADSKSATAEADGLLRADLSFAVITADGGRVTSCLVDQLQAKATLKADGTVTELEYKTKKQLGEQYGLKKASPIGKEWYEQVAAFESFASGGFESIAISDSGHAENPDLKAGCTIRISPFVNIVKKALENA